MRPPPALLALFSTLLAALPASPDELEELVRRQGQELARLRTEVHHLRQESRAHLDAAVSDYLAGSDAHGADGAPKEPPFGGRVRLGGYFTIEFRDDGKGKNATFDQHRLVPKLQAEIAEAISFETEIEIEGGGTAEFLEDAEILVEYAELTFEIIEQKLSLVTGLLLVPWGRFNEFHDDPLNDLTDRPLVSRYIGAVAFDQPGVGAEGTLELGGGWFLDYQACVVTGFDGEIDAADGAREGRQGFRSDNNDNKEIFWRLVLNIPIDLVDNLEVGYSGTWGRYDDEDRHSVYGYAFELSAKRGRLEFVAEYMNLDLERDAAAPPTEPRRMDGWYVEGRVHFFPSAWRGRHKLLTEESTFTLVLRVEGLDLNHSTTGTTFRDGLLQYTIGFNFRPVERTVFKISYAVTDSDEPDSDGKDILAISCATFF